MRAEAEIIPTGPGHKFFDLTEMQADCALIRGEYRRFPSPILADQCPVLRRPMHCTTVPTTDELGPARGALLGMKTSWRCSGYA